MKKIILGMFLVGVMMLPTFSHAQVPQVASSGEEVTMAALQQLIVQLTAQVAVLMEQLNAKIAEQEGRIVDLEETNNSTPSVDVGGDVVEETPAPTPVVTPTEPVQKANCGMTGWGYRCQASS